MCARRTCSENLMNDTRISKVYKLCNEKTKITTIIERFTNIESSCQKIKRSLLCNSKISNCLHNFCLKLLFSQLLIFAVQCLVSNHIYVMDE